MKTSKKYNLIIIGIIILVLFTGSFFYLKNSNLRNQILNNQIVQHFIHTYYSVRKIPDLLFIPYMMMDSKIPTYTLQISLDNIARMNSMLPEDPIFGKLEDENKLYVSANFSSLEYDDRVKVKYRGLNSNHWNKQKKSIRIKYPDGNYFNGMRLLNFITPFDRGYLIELLNMYRAKKFGLIDVDMYFSRLNINGIDTGVYLTFEHFSPEWLAKKGLPEEKLFGIKDGDVNLADDPSDYINMFEKEIDEGKEEIVAFLSLLQHSDDTTFRKLIPHIVDLDKLYKWNIINILAGSNHQTEAGNAILYFNSAVGKFEIVPWDTNINDQSTQAYHDNESLLMSRVLSIPKFREKRDELLREYIENEKNFNDDLAFYDQLYKQTKADFFKDNHKLFNNFQFLSSIRKQKQLILNNWNRSSDVLDPEYDYSYQIDVEDIKFTESFINFKDVSKSVDLFISENKQFYKIDNNNIGLVGSQYFNEDVIIPSGLTLNITAGANLYMGDGVSIVSYSPVQILGVIDNPISIIPSSRKPWGTFAVVNSSTSTVRHLIAVGGSGDRINGIPFTGMVAFHNSDSYISNSTFGSAKNDDALNIKMSGGWIKYSIFIDNSSDGIDIDYPKTGFEITGNDFVKNGGDAIDLSHSDILISKNKINVCGDKGISVGEMSIPKITRNIISECIIGIAVKDLSNANITENIIKNNKTAISLYRKKSEFGGGYAILNNNDILENENNVVLDEYSNVDYE